jgi:hypothetical protein
MATSLGKVGIVDKGNYSSEATYNSGDFIFYEGSTWLALKDGLTGIKPTEGEEWKYLARGVPDGIARPDQIGLVKPSEDLTITEDGTLGINTVFETIAERANIESGDTWNTVLGKINKYFGDIKPHAFLDKITEDYIDNVITQKVNNAIQKAAIVNNAVTTIEGTVLDGRMGKTLQDQITEQNKNINNNLQMKILRGFGSIGLSGTFSLLDVINAMPDSSILYAVCDANSTITDIPTPLGNLEVQRLNDNRIKLYFSSAENGKIYERYYRTSEGGFITNWQNLVINSDLRRHAFSFAYGSKTKDEAIQAIFYQLPNDNELHFCSLYLGGYSKVFVQKYNYDTYGSVLLWGYGDNLVQYKISNGVWYKNTINMTTTTIPNSIS